MILVTGAAGKTGLALIAALTEQGAPVRGLVHQEQYRPQVEQVGAEEILVGDLLDRKALSRAMRGIRAVYHIPPNLHPREVEIGEYVIAEALQADVEHFIYHSVLHPQLEEMPHHWFKLKVEELLITSGLQFTILQPTAYMQNITNQLDRIAQSGIYQIPYAATTSLSLVDLKDVATVAARLLVEGGHHGAIYQLVGTGLISQIEVASLLGILLEREIQAKQISLEDWQAEISRTGLGSYQISTLVKMFLFYQNHGFVGNPLLLQWLLGRQPTSLESCLRREIDRLGIQ
ncbi:MAG: SDR family oxidoreductase [Anaerolineales bacterium]|jgi:NAD(P)H dehydrogenase (quinone)